ncbi:chitin disaccharide deacetylase [Bacillus sp. CLL-7-23]|uniref:Carbohydrate deacetylase n=1 Tax=Bacillus changyiensis TaxID=3004103 RepID=A0ABT4X241_9BACI|nr:chitin disaccharide deacetylase [Bacillus changyiensis]MDA7026374.1 chitin disaccharide deacetylase [Bacillus changyiensis]
MKKLIINADDFGFSRGVNYGIIDAYQLGILTSTTLMTNMPDADHAVRLAGECPGLGVGVHLVLTCGKPLLLGHRTIVDVKGNFRDQAFYKGAFTVDLDEVYREWRAQIEKCLAYGVEPDHLDTHHHIHRYHGITDVFVTLAKEYRLPVRNHLLETENMKTTDCFCPLLESTLKDSEAITQLFEEYQSIEVMTHPAYLDKKLLSSSSFTYPRVDELEFLTDPNIIHLLTSFEDIELSTFKQLI